MFTALAALPDTSRVGVLLTSDEESGSGTSRALIEAEARRSGAVLVLEASTPDGDLKVARKGGSAYRIGIHGRASHAGSAPHLGVNATVEAANLVLALQSLARAEGTTITPTVLTAGTTSNTVPAYAALCIDVRAWHGDELDRVDRAIRALAPALAEARLTVEGGVNRYPLTPELALPLLEIAQVVAREIGMPPPAGSHAPGASDGNFTAALGVPTLDGLGGVGAHAHAREEYVEAWLMPQRAALLAALVERLVEQPSRWGPRLLG
jgi:glutamate carboxypeptidase